MLIQIQMLLLSLLLISNTQVECYVDESSSNRLAGQPPKPRLEDRGSRWDEGYNRLSEPARCIVRREPPETKYFYLNSVAERIRILTSQNPTQRLISEVFRIFGTDVLGYSLDITINSNHSTALDPETQFSNISTCQVQYCGDMDKDPGVTRIPSEMVVLGVMLPPSYHVDSWNLLDIGQLGPAIRLGWFVPTRLTLKSAQVWDHWKTYTNSGFVGRIRLLEREIQIIEQNLVDENGRYFCDVEDVCRAGVGVGEGEGGEAGDGDANCNNIRGNCAILITDYPVESSLFTTQTILKQTKELGMKVVMVFVGHNLENVIDALHASTQGSQRSYLLLAAHPSTYTTRHNYTQIKFPSCKDPLMMREKDDISCIYSPHRMAKVIWKYVRNGAPSLFSFIENFSFTYSEFVSLMRMYNKMKEEDPTSTINSIACKWLLHEPTEGAGPWYTKYSAQIESKQLLHIGGIFPISGRRYTAPSLATVALMAVQHINDNSTILPRHLLSLDTLDGQCEPDVVMKKFIDVVKTKDIQRFSNTAGILGPACSDTVEPLAGVAKHFRTVVITYSAEGSISNENRKDYPYFFRTIAENKMYKHAYIETLRELKWSKIAALTQDGQKYSDHISELQDEFQRNGITFILNRKFPKDTIVLEMYLRDLKEKKAKIIIGDFYEETARIVMCEAWKQSMTQRNGYVWFLPGWFTENWYDIDHLKAKRDKAQNSKLKQDGHVNIVHTTNYTQGSVVEDDIGQSPLEDFNVYQTGYLPNCTTHQMRSALDGHLSLVHANYADDSQIMQANQSVMDWKKTLNSFLKTTKKDFINSKTMTSARETGRYDNARRIQYNTDSEPNKYSGYVYDAVWLYALALDELIRENKSYVQDLHSGRTVNKFVEIINNTDFMGVTGRINFGGRNSRLSEIMIKQWHNSSSLSDRPYTQLIGVYEPEYSSELSDGGKEEKKGKWLSFNESSLIWKTVDGLKPADHDKECGVLSSFATSLNIDCQLAITIAFIVGFCIVFFIIVILFFCFKQRYERKMQAQEDRMRALGLMEPITMLALDEWEVARDRVVINRKLGEGAFGTVYGGECFFDEKGWVAVAVKTLKVGSTHEVKIDFLSEAEMMKRFNHKNIVKLLGVCTNHEPVYTVMEYMLYGDLKTYLLARRHLVNERNREELDEVSNRRLTSMALDIARGLAYLADLKYVHRDVACRNCLVNGSRTVKLADFGMTRAMFESDYYRFNRRGMLPVRWMSPESLADGLFTPSSDVWSYGVLLYEIITFGSFPFQGLSNNQVLDHVKLGNTLSVPSGIKQQLENLLRTCWRPEPTKRPTAGEIVELLGNNPRLISPCIDVPLASVAIERTDSLELIPARMSTTESRKPSSIHSTNRRGRESLPLSLLVNHLSGSGHLNGHVGSGSSHLNGQVTDDAGYGSTAYSPMHVPANGGGGQTLNGVITEGYGLREPLLREVEHPSSYVPPGYIYLEHGGRRTQLPEDSQGLASI